MSGACGDGRHGRRGASAPRRGPVLRRREPPASRPRGFSMQLVLRRGPITATRFATADWDHLLHRGPHKTVRCDWRVTTGGRVERPRVSSIPPFTRSVGLERSIRAAKSEEEEESPWSPPKKYPRSDTRLFPRKNRSGRREYSYEGGRGGHSGRDRALRAPRHVQGTRLSWSVEPSGRSSRLGKDEPHGKHGEKTKRRRSDVEFGNDELKG